MPGLPAGEWGMKAMKSCARVLCVLWVSLAASQANAGLLGSLGNMFGDSEQELAEWLDEPTQPLKWGEWEYVQLAVRGPGENGALNQHPAQLNAERLAEVLARVRVKVSNDKRRLFTDEEVLRLARAASGALARADAHQDFVFRTAARHQELGLIGQKLVNSGRIFVADGRLNIIIGTQQSEALLGLRPGMRPTRSMDPGSRAKQSAQVEILPGGGPGERLVRADWLAVELSSLVAAERRPAAEASRVAPTPAAASAAPAVTSTPLSAPAESKAEERLRVLKRLFDKGLISEGEYQQKRTTILNEL